MILATTLELFAYGTSEGAEKAWDTRGRKLYHVTYTKLVPKIQKEGLRPMQTSNWVTSGDKQRYGGGQVFTFAHPQDALRWAAKMDWAMHTATGSGKISIIKLAGKEKWTIDTADPIGQSSAKGHWLKYQGAVSPDRIEDSRKFTPDLVKHLMHTGKDFKF